ncbi:MAG: hypothetical protein ACRECR_01190 [Thermoplasmata archaeon]
MRRGILIAGIIVLVIGVLIVVGGYVAESASQSSAMPGYPDYLSQTPTAIGGVHESVSWSGESPGASVYLTDGTPSCPATSGTVVAQGTGASGSFSASLSSGTTYALYSCNGSASGSVSTSTTGISILVLIGIVLAVLGAIVALVGARARPKTRPAPSEVPVEAAPSEEPSAYFVPKPMTAQEAGSASTGTTPIGTRPEPPTPAQFMPAYDPGASGATASGPGGARPNRTCNYCGTVNESWITNCRKCKRPLASTSTGGG